MVSSMHVMGANFKHAMQMQCEWKFVRKCTVTFILAHFAFISTHLDAMQKLRSALFFNADYLGSHFAK